MSHKMSHKSLDTCFLKNIRIYDVSGFTSLHGKNHLEPCGEFNSPQFVILLFSNIWPVPLFLFLISGFLYTLSTLAFPFTVLSEFNTSLNSLASLP